MRSRPSVPARIRAGLVAVLLGCTALAASDPASRPAGVAAAAAPAGEVWLTLDADLLARALREAPLLQPLEAGETGEILLVRAPVSFVDTLAAVVHRELGRCGGFVAHASLEAGRVQLERLEQTRAAPREERSEGVAAFTVDQPGWAALLADGVSESELLATMTTVSTSFVNRYHAHPSGSAAATWIFDRWSALAAGRPEAVVELLEHADTPQPSVRLTIPGTRFPEQIVLLGGHQDSTVSGCFFDPGCVAPGADDDASGIATLTEVARLALASGFQPQRTVQLVAYAAEEVGLIGSSELAEAYLDAGAEVVGVLQVDMTGYPGSAEDIVLISDYTDSALNDFLVGLLETYQPGLAWTTDECGYACSDHAPWHLRGYPAAFAFEARFGQHNPEIHSADDTVATLDDSAAHAAKFTRLAAAFLAEAALVDPGVLFADGFERGTASAWSPPTD